VTKKKVLLTINPMLLESRRFSTMRRLIRWLDRCCDLRLVPVSGYDFKRGRVTTYRRRPDGSFEKMRHSSVPRADLWIVYSDGFYLDPRAFGFKLRRDYLQAQLAFHEEQLRMETVRVMINSPEAEARTLKSWLATLDFQSSRVIPTYLFSGITEVYDLQRARGTIVAKLNWGGANLGVERLRSESCVREFERRLKECADRDLSDYCFQPYCRGEEKRFWFAGGKCLAARVIHGRETPWSGMRDNFRVAAYDADGSAAFARDLSAARRLIERAGIDVGSVDFIGSRINEVNGGGTVLTTYCFDKMVIDVRPAFLQYIQSLLHAL
jgi:hypothetical protein